MNQVYFMLEYKIMKDCDLKKTNDNMKKIHNRKPWLEQPHNDLPKFPLIWTHDNVSSCNCIKIQAWLDGIIVNTGVVEAICNDDWITIVDCFNNSSIDYNTIKIRAVTFKMHTFACWLTALFYLDPVS